MSESKLQQECVKWFRYQHPGILIASIPNAGKRGIATASRMKAEGIMPGMPDLVIPVPNKDFHALFIEMKYGKGTTSPEQKEVIRRLQNTGYAVYVCRSFDEFRKAVEEYLQNN